MSRRAGTHGSRPGLDFDRQTQHTRVMNFTWRSLTMNHITSRISKFALLLLALAFTALPAMADTMIFTGTRSQRTPSASPVGRCAPRPTANLIPRPGTDDFNGGTSNFGAFTSVQSHCVNLPFPNTNAFDSGLFTWTFANGDTLTGTYSGALTGVFTPGGFSVRTYASVEKPSNLSLCLFPIKHP